MSSDELGVYLPSLGTFAYRSSRGIADQVVPFGAAGAGASLPVTGDYDGDGLADPAVYLPALGAFAYRPSLGGADVVQPFGIAGDGQTLPVAGSTATTKTGTVAAASVAESSPVPTVVEIPLSGGKKRRSV